MATFTGTSGTDNFIGTDTVADLFRFTPANLAGVDTVVGGLGTVNDTLQLLAAGTVTAAQLANVSGIEFVTMFAGSSIELTANMLATSRLGLITVTGSAGNDTVFADAVTNSAHRVTFNAGAGRDTFLGGAGLDIVNIAAADLTSADFLSGNGNNADLITLTTAGSLSTTAFDNVYSFERINLNAGGNSITLHQSTVGSTASGVVAVTGGAGNDYVDASTVVNGRVSFAAGEGVNEFYGTPSSDSATGGGSDDVFVGNGGNDTLVGGFGNNTIYGGDANDTISNDGGASLVWGGAGADTIQLYSFDAAGADIIYYAAPTEGTDTIKGDLGSVADGDIVFWLDNPAFTTNGNNFDLVNFDNGTNGVASDGADLVLYNDGAGPGLGSTAGVDQYFFDNYFAVDDIGAFLFDYNNDTSTATLYYDADAFSHSTVVVLAKVQGVDAADFAAMGDDFAFV